ncbi:MAG: PKD domain-containing protein [Bacteroidia bacterium]
MKKRHHYFFSKLLLMLFLAHFSVQANAQCTIVASDYTGCVPFPITFSIQKQSGKTVKSVAWNFGDGSSSTENEPTHVFNARGTFKVSASITYNDNSTCNSVYRSDIKIYDNPVAVLDMQSAYKTCWYNPSIQFEHASSEGADKAKILRYTWDLGDGDTSNRESFKYTYENNGDYRLVLEVMDANGCKDTVSKKINYFMYKEVKPDFFKFQKDSCPQTEVVFRNRTDTAGFHIQKVEWDFGNGKGQLAEITDTDWDNKWSRANAVYTGNKRCKPSITITNKIGCVASFQRYSIENIFFRFNAKATPDSTCYDWGQTGPIVRFTHPEIDGFRKVQWTFGDPQSQSNSAFDQFNPVHEYTEPGKFTVRLRIEKKGCVRDTKYCAMIRVYGAQARINKFPREFNDTLIGHPFFPNTFPENFDTCNNDSFTYYTLDTQKVTLSRHSYCNATKLDSTQSGEASKCKGVLTRFDYDLQPTSTITYMGNKITRKKQKWLKGDPLPKGPLYSNYIGKNIPGNLHDSELFACTVPHTVNFINNSIKYRNFEAVDNFTPGYPDSCVNPSYPWASDSMNYFWDFGEGSIDTSTASNPNQFCRFSTERLPIHTYVIAGCYKVKMWATDPVTGCTSDDSVYISAQSPSAGWDTAYDSIKNMNYRTQRKLEGGKYRRGLIVKGLECTDYKQTPDISELLPSCQLEKYWIVFDSAQQTTFSICNGDTILKHNWIESQKVPRNQVVYRYSTTGWKTVGIVVKNGNCFDTVWYHNYKYVYTANAFSNVSNYHFCVDDTIISQLVDTLQEGIKYAWFKYEFRTNISDDWQEMGFDTLEYLRYNDNGQIRKITSTMHNSVSGVEDDTTYNNLAEKSYFKFSKPGVYKVTSTVLHRFGCEYIDETEVAVGHRAKFAAEHETVCIGDSLQFIDTVQYYKSFLASGNPEGIDSILYWNDPIGKRRGIKPRFAEQIRWDFDNDGIFDAYGSNPKWVYKQPGIYTVLIQTRDSMNCNWLTTIKKNYIKVVSVNAKFKVANNDSVRFCAPQLFVFKDESKILDGAEGKEGYDNIQYWEWDWGNGQKALRSNLDNGTVGHLYKHNGIYTIKLKTFLSTHFITDGKGCVDSSKIRVFIEGPLPKFSLVGDSVGCVPFKTTVKDTSQKTTVWEWHLGDGRTKPSYGEKLVDLTYNKPGIYCISLFAGDSIVDFSGKKLFCVDDYPYRECDIKVRVLPKNEISLKHDSLLCINELGAFDFSESHNSYKNFEVYFGDKSDTIATNDKVVNYGYDSLANYNLFYTGSGARCPDTAYSNVGVIGIKADFDLDSSRLDTPKFWFKNQSLSGVDFEWTFDDKVVITNDLDDVVHEFDSPGTKQICLIAKNEKGCADTLCKWLQIETNIWIPNVMTLNNDGFNDRFKILIKGHTQYNLLVYNRWGELVFESTEFDYLWNGRKFNTKEECLSGTYFYLLKYQLIGEEPKRRTGSITLIRAN